MMRETILQAMGAASLCWTPIPTGIFDEARVLVLTNQLIHDIKEDLRDRQTLKTFVIYSPTTTLQQSCDLLNTQINAYIDAYKPRYGYTVTHETYPSTMALSESIVYCVTVQTHERRL